MSSLGCVMVAWSVTSSLLPLFHVIEKSMWSNLVHVCGHLILFFGGGGGEGGTLFSRRLRLWSPEPRRDRGRNVKKKKWCFLKIFFIWMAMANTSHKPLWHGHQTGIATSRIGSIFFQFLEGISLVFRDQGSKLSEILGSWITKCG